MKPRIMGLALSAPVTLWLLMAFATPMAVVVLLSLHDVPDPFAPILSPLSLAMFSEILTDWFLLGVILETVLLGVWASLPIGDSYPNGNYFPKIRFISYWLLSHISPRPWSWKEFLELEPQCLYAIPFLLQLEQLFYQKLQFGFYLGQNLGSFQTMI